LAAFLRSPVLAVWVWFAFAALVVGSVTGCGDDDDATTQTGGDATTDSTDTTDTGTTVDSNGTTGDETGDDGTTDTGATTDEGTGDGGTGETADTDDTGGPTERVVDLVNPFIGTGGTSFASPNCYPGPVAPIGMIQPGPVTTNESGIAASFNHAAGFQADDTRLAGFTHNRMQGVSTPDLNALLLLPLWAETPKLTNRLARSWKIDLKSQSAAPGYYSVTDKATGLRAELAANAHGAIERYTFPAEGGTPALVVDPWYAPPDTTVADAPFSFDRTTGTITGSVATRGRFTSNSTDFRTHFDAVITPAWTETRALTSPDGSGRDATLLVWPAGTTTVEVRIALSYVDSAGAALNRSDALRDKPFESVVAETAKLWESLIGRVRFTGGDEGRRRVMATALYHSFVMPHLFTDLDGRYRGVDGAVHEGEPGGYMQTFSLWDTYRTVHPLWALVAPEMQKTAVESILTMVREGGGYLPRWPAGFAETNVTLGDPAAVMLGDSFLRGVTGFDTDAALTAMLRAATTPTPPGQPFAGREGVAAYNELGYVPADAEGRSVSKTLEYAIADGAIARMAEALGDAATATVYAARAQNYANLWDPALRVFRGKNRDGSFSEPFDARAYQSENLFYGGNGVQHAWLVPHDMPGLRTLFNDDAAMLADLTALFENQKAIEDNPAPVTGLVPPVWYYHGNQPTIHAAYVFLALARPDLTQKWLAWVAETYYDDSPTGIPGNEDSGALSAWFVWNAMGLYPVPGSDVLMIGRPLFDGLDVQVTGGTLTIDSPGGGENSPMYVGGVRLNGTPLPHPWMRQSEIAQGGLLEFDLIDAPTDWGQNFGQP
jgi:predicted alpha-1,2-mannosidase